MKSSRTSRRIEPDADRRAGLRADPAALRSRLATASSPFVEGAMANAAMSAEHAALALRNPRVGGSVVQRIARRPEWTRSYAVKAGLACHPATPMAAARALLHHLHWPDLVAVASSSRLHPAIRRRAEQLVETRLAAMTLGEKVALARRAGRALIRALALDGEPRVVDALLHNPKVFEDDVVAIARHRGLPGEALAIVADHPKWRSRIAIRSALVRNPSTPVHAVLRLAARMPDEELRRVANAKDAPRIVRRVRERRPTTNV